jgi:hypothetical protein
MAMSALDRCRHFGVTNIRGIAYMPGPTNYHEGSGPGTLYENSDFYTNIFEDLWGYTNPNGMGEQGRRDLERYKQQLGINFIHCYDWAAPVTQVDQNKRLLTFLTHTGFLRVCASLGMKATVPVSNYTMKLLSEGKADEARRNIGKVFAEAYTPVPPPSMAPFPGVGMWKIFNEYELWYGGNPQYVVTVMTWLAEWEATNSIQDQNALPVMVCTSFGMDDGIEGAGYLKKVRDAMLQKPKIGNYTPADFWNDRIVFATNPQNDGPDIQDYLNRRLPNYWKSKVIPTPPVMFTELGSSIEQTGGERQQADWLTRQILASKPGSSEGHMLGACVFLNEERPWASGAERTFGITRFRPDSSWPYPPQNFEAKTKFPVWDPNGWYWQKDATYPVEQQAPKMNYQSVAKAWKSG